MAKAHDLTGQRFDRLTAVRRLANGKNGHARWYCECDCGGTTESFAGHLRSGQAKSCGCIRRENGKVNGPRNGRVGAAALRTHGHAGKTGRSPTYLSWEAMNERCGNPKAGNWKYYGARGITICDRWQGKDGFQNFLADMGERPPGKTLDRYPDNNGNYEPGNCRWATAKQQVANRRVSKSEARPCL